MVWTHALPAHPCTSADKPEAKWVPGGTPMKAPFYSPRENLTDSTECISDLQQDSDGPGI